VDLAVPLPRLLAELALVLRAGLRLVVAAPVEREEPLLERERDALGRLRVDAADFVERDALGRLRVDAADFDRDEPLVFGFDLDAFDELFGAFDELLLLLLRLAAALLLAIRKTSRLEGVRCAYPLAATLTKLQGIPQPLVQMSHLGYDVGS
jgi:hypothetical protein